MANERVEYIDMAAGIMILWMMLGHCGITGTNWGQMLYRLFFYFMPWFFYKSGMFFCAKDERIMGGVKF